MLLFHTGRRVHRARPGKFAAPARLIYPLPFSPLTGAGVGPSQIGERGGAIWNDRLTWVSRLTGGAKLLGFVCGMLQVSPGRYPPAVTPGRYRPIPLVVLYLLVLLAFSVSAVGLLRNHHARLLTIVLC